MSPYLRDFLELLRTGDAFDVSDACDRGGQWEDCCDELVAAGGVSALRQAAARHHDDAATVANVLFVLTELFRLETPDPCPRAALAVAVAALRDHPEAEVTVSNACETVVYASRSTGGAAAIAASGAFQAVITAAHSFTPAEQVFTSLVRACRCDPDAFLARGGVELLVSAMCWPGAHRAVLVLAADVLRNDAAALARAVRIGALGRLRGLESTLRADPAVARVVRMLVARMAKESRVRRLAPVYEDSACDMRRRAAAADAAAAALLAEEHGASAEAPKAAPKVKRVQLRGLAAAAFRRRILESLNLTPNPYRP